MSSLSKRHSESWREALKFIGRCPICDKNYNTEAARLFAEKESINLVHVTCGSCGSALISMILVVGQGLSSVGMVTDLSFEDAGRIFERGPISLDEAISACELLEGESILKEITS